MSQRFVKLQSWEYETYQTLYYRCNSEDSFDKEAQYNVLS